MRNIIKIATIILLFLNATITLMADEKKGKKDDFVTLTGRVKDAVTKIDLPDAIVIKYDRAGNPTDTVKANSGMRMRHSGETETISSFYIWAYRTDSIVTFDVECPGYETLTVTYLMEDVGKRQNFHKMPITYLQRKARQLDEVTVTASKIKFYNRGDTIVFNADAFQLAEGSMLDALISQLPGVELNSEGQIKVNGEFVESLLLNGKQFLDGNNQLMLENIGAYTVKNVEVYRGQTKMEKWENNPLAEKHLTMDVKLKKEYNMGWIINAQGGIGTHERYNGRLFASWFTPTTNITLLGNLNNLNDTRKPGKNDSWTPERMPKGSQEYKMATVNYDYQSLDETRQFNGYVTYEGTHRYNRLTTARTNFFSSGDTYDNVFKASRDNNLKLESRNYLNLYNTRNYLWGMLLGRYIKKDDNSSTLSASFREEQADITAKVLEALYSDSSPERLDAIINRSITRAEGKSTEGEVQFYPTYNLKIPGSNDQLTVQGGLRYKSVTAEQWRDYNINYGTDPTPSVVRRQYFDNSPDNTLTVDGNIGYQGYPSKSTYFRVIYDYTFRRRNRDSYMYELDQLADMGIFGVIPEGYLSTLDPDNSYTSTLNENEHSFGAYFRWYNVSDNHYVQIFLQPQIMLANRHLFYYRGNVLYNVKHSAWQLNSKSPVVKVTWQLGRKIVNKRAAYNHRIEYTYNIKTSAPDMLHMVDIVNDSNPLNISVGNPDLKNSFAHTHNISWNFTPPGKYLSNRLAVDMSYTDNAIVRGYTYDTSTGVRRTRSYNVDGNNSFGLMNYFNLQFGSKQQFTVSSSTIGRLMKYADMIGVDEELPTKSEVSTNTITQGLNLSWNFAKHTLRASGSFTNRHTSSSREDFTSINANHFQYGVNGIFSLPAGFGIATDFTIYSRRGYGVKELDTNDVIWNLRLSYTPRKSHWVFTLDGFDMLHQLSNVSYAVNASGRTVSYSNTLPRYILLSAQYRLNIQPKKRK